MARDSSRRKSCGTLPYQNPSWKTIKGHYVSRFMIFYNSAVIFPEVLPPPTYKIRNTTRWTVISWFISSTASAYSKAEAANKMPVPCHPENEEDHAKDRWGHHRLAPFKQARNSNKEKIRPLTSETNICLTKLFFAEIVILETNKLNPIYEQG